MYRKCLLHSVCLKLNLFKAKTALYYFVFFMEQPFYLLFVGEAMAGEFVLFSCVHVTLEVTLSVRQSVGPLVSPSLGWSVHLSFRHILHAVEIFAKNLSKPIHTQLIAVIYMAFSKDKSAFSIHLSINLSAHHPSLPPSIAPSVYPSVHPSFHPSFPIPLSPSLSVPLYITLSQETGIFRNL